MACTGRNRCDDGRDVERRKFPAGGWVIGASDLRGVFDSGVRRELELGQVPERIANLTINDIAGPAAKVLYLGNPFAALLVGTAIYDNWYNTAYGRDLANITSEKDFDTLLRRIAPTYVIFDTAKVGQRYTIAGDYLRHEASPVTPIGRPSIYRLHSPRNKMKKERPDEKRAVASGNKGLKHSCACQSGS